MNGMNILFLLIFISALPVFFLYLWFHLSRFSLPLYWFLLFLLAGALSLLVALVLQHLLPDIPPGAGGRGRILYMVFCKVALVEETGRLLVLLAFFRIAARFSVQSGGGENPVPRPQGNTESISNAGAVPGSEFWGALTGLVAGLGFAIIENASYGSVDMGIAFVRAFTAAPLHGACGARVGAAVAGLHDNPFSALPRFLSAVALHGMYNFMILLRGVSWILAILVAFSALASSILFIRAGFKSFNGNSFLK
jgi:RsiW-degrading membrane proteinase PrsW (M82 family)